MIGILQNFLDDYDTRYSLALSSFNIEPYYFKGMLYVNVQIFEWLGSMPVELEGYIRPGCTILTVFIAMPQHMWDKVCHVFFILYNSYLFKPNEQMLNSFVLFSFTMYRL